MKITLLFIVCSMSFTVTSAQTGGNDTNHSRKSIRDSIHNISGVTINGIKQINGVERLPDNRDGVIYSGQKNVVLVLDSMNSNTAQSSMREELGRVPGANIAE